jgi:hypothetical protein
MVVRTSMVVLAWLGIGNWSGSGDLDTPGMKWVAGSGDLVDDDFFSLREVPGDLERSLVV